VLAYPGCPGKVAVKWELPVACLCYVLYGIKQQSSTVISAQLDTD